MPRWLRWTGLGLLAAGVMVALLFVAFVVLPQREKHPPLLPATGSLALRNATIYLSPNQPPIEHADLLVTDGRIAAVGPGMKLPANAVVLACNGCVVTAGFWNVHVHFTEPKWSGANWKSADQLNAQLADMLTSRGFTTVADLGSNYIDTLALRRRIEHGELAGPYIYTAEGALYPPHGIPFYLRETLPKPLQWLMAQPDTPEQAVRDVEQNQRQGADLIKLFTGSYVERGKVKPMALPIAQAAVHAAHAGHMLVFCHPSNLAGTQVAIRSRADVLAHAPDSTEGITNALLAEAVVRNMAMVPTLKMFATTVTTRPSYLNPIYDEVRNYHRMGGELLFGTDVGYMHDYTTEGEFTGLSASGITPMEMLAMLTTNPARRFGVADQKGYVVPGMLADITVLAGDPAQNIGAFSQVIYTIRSGRVIYRKP